MTCRSLFSLCSDVERIIHSDGIFECQRYFEVFGGLDGFGSLDDVFVEVESVLSGYFLCAGLLVVATCTSPATSGEIKASGTLIFVRIQFEQIPLVAGKFLSEIHLKAAVNLIYGAAGSATTRVNSRLTRSPRRRSVEPMVAPQGRGFARF